MPGSLHVARSTSPRSHKQDRHWVWMWSCSHKRVSWCGSRSSLSVMTRFVLALHLFSCCSPSYLVDQCSQAPPLSQAPDIPWSGQHHWPRYSQTDTFDGMYHWSMEKGARKISSRDESMLTHLLFAYMPLATDHITFHRERWVRYHLRQISGQLQSLGARVPGNR